MKKDKTLKDIVRIAELVLTIAAAIFILVFFSHIFYNYALKTGSTHAFLVGAGAVLFAFVYLFVERFVRSFYERNKDKVVIKGDKIPKAKVHK